MHPCGWSDPDLWALMRLLRTHVLYYIYASDDKFAAAVQPTLSHKSPKEIVDAVRALMKAFGVALSTRAFRSDVLHVENEQAIIVHEFLYEMTKQLAENQCGGIWHPDELSRFLEKVKAYRLQFDTSHELFFSRVQIWGKSVADTRTKFYALRTVYVNEKSSLENQQQPVSDIAWTRFQVLKKIFANVPPQPKAVEARLTSNKAQTLWSPEDLQKLLGYLKDITLQVQKTGTSALVQEVALSLGRSNQSCVNKLFDMHERYCAKSSYFRAAHLPDEIYDSNSLTHQIFNADWTNINDPNAMGYLALKRYSNQIIASRHRKRPSPKVLPRKIGLRSRKPANAPQHESSQSSSNAATNIRLSLALPTDTITTIHKSVTSGSMDTTTSVLSKCDQHLSKREGVNGEGSDATPFPQADPKAEQPQYSDFVQECASLNDWSEHLTYSVCVEMLINLALYRKMKVSKFFKRIARAVPAVNQPELFISGSRILNLFEERHSNFDLFQDIVRGTTAYSANTKPSTPDSAVLPAHTPGKLTENPPRFLQGSDKENETPSGKSSQLFTQQEEVVKVPTTISTASERPEHPAGHDISEASEPHMNSSTAAEEMKATPVVGKANTKTQSMLQPSVACMDKGDQIDSSPSIQQSSSEHYNSDDMDPGLGEQEEEDDDDDNDNRSVASSGRASYASSEYGKPDGLTSSPAPPSKHMSDGSSIRHLHEPSASGLRHGSDSPRISTGKRRMTSSKTVVVTHSSRSCCSCCGHHRRAARSTVRMHRKRHVHEVYADQDHWYEEDSTRPHHRQRHHCYMRYNQHNQRHCVNDVDDIDRDQFAGGYECSNVPSAYSDDEGEAVWMDLMAPIDSRINELQAQQRELMERKEDREREERRKQWKDGVRMDMYALLTQSE